jgi:hypothetical protein
MTTGNLSHGQGRPASTVHCGARGGTVR